MRKERQRFFSVLVLCIYLVVIWSVTTVQAASFQMPEYESFMPGKVAEEIEAVVNQKSVLGVTAEDNKVSVEAEPILEKHRAAVLEMDEYLEKLNQAGMFLNRSLKNTVTVEVKGLDFSEFAEVSIDWLNLSQLTEVNCLKLILRNRNEYIVLDKKCIGRMVGNSRMFRMQIRRDSDNYQVQFLSSYGSVINRYVTDVKIALPASHSEQTVHLSYGETKENWGGQYNRATGSVEFLTRYSGDYTVASPDIDIRDIAKLSPEEQKAIRFMAVRDYFWVDHKNFYPDAKLTRYDFARALARMFYALDDEAECTFWDVGSRNYRYVAAAQSREIVQGFSDGSFRGYENVTAEQVIALTARTIHQENGYVYPENPEKYWNVSKDNPMGQWAEKEVALAIREGIYSPAMGLRFSEDISRKDAAVLLYRLFMIVNNTPEPIEVIQYDGEMKAEHKTP